MNKEGKVFKIILVIFGVIILAVAGVGVYLYKTYLSSPPIVVGAMTVEQGDVLVNGVAATGTTEVKQGDSIETKNGKAIVTLYESILVGLEPHTKIVLKDMTAPHPQVEQIQGKTWNQFTKSGGVTGYTIVEESNRASVIGTTFQFSQGKVVTAEGTVSYESQGQTYNVTSGHVVETTNGQTVERVANPTERVSIRIGLEQSVRELRQLRNYEVAKYPELIAQLKQQFNLTDVQIQTGLISADNGQLNIDDVVHRLPVAIPAITRVVEITKSIQTVQAELNRP